MGSCGHSCSVVGGYRVLRARHNLCLSRCRSRFCSFCPVLTVHRSHEVGTICGLDAESVVSSAYCRSAVTRTEDSCSPRCFSDSRSSHYNFVLPRFSGVSVIGVPCESVMPQGVSNLLLSKGSVKRSCGTLRFAHVSTSVAMLKCIANVLTTRVLGGGYGIHRLSMAPMRGRLVTDSCLPTSTAITEGMSLRSVISGLDAKSRAILFGYYVRRGGRVLPLLRTTFRGEPRVFLTGTLT